MVELPLFLRRILLVSSGARSPTRLDLHSLSLFRLIGMEDGHRKPLQNDSNHLPIEMVPHPRGLESSSPLL
jgi:hypothetical protein